MNPFDDSATLAGKISGSGSVLAVANNAQVSLLSAIFTKFKGAKIEVAEKAFDADSKHFPAGSLLITGAPTGTTDDQMAGRDIPKASHSTQAASQPRRQSLPTP